jgi:RNA recognition motif-containing protein
MTEEEQSFPRTVFVQDLPSEYSMSGLAVLLEQFGDILEMQLMEDAHVLVRFQDGASAKNAVAAASGSKKRKLMFEGKQIRVVPKRKRLASQD